MIGISQTLSYALLINFDFNVQKVIDSYSDETLFQLLNFRIGQAIPEKEEVC